VELRQPVGQDRLVLGEDGIEASVLGDALKRDVGNGLVVEPAGWAVDLVAEPVVVELRRHQALAGNCERNTAGVDGGPAPTPSLGNVGGRPRAARRIKYEVSRIGGHEEATCDDL